MFKKLFIIVLIFILNSTCIFAEDLKIIDLKTAIEIAQKNNLDIQSSKIDVGIAKNDIKAANRLQNPAVNAFFNFGEAGKGNPNQIGLSETIELFKRAPRKKLAKANYTLTSEMYDYEKFNLKMDVTEAYVNLIIAKFILKKYEQQQEYLKNLLEIANRNGNIKSSTDLDIIQSRLALNEIIIKVNKARTNVNKAKIEFNNQVNTVDCNYDVAEIDLRKETDLTELNLPLINKKLPEFKNIENLAVKNRFDVKIAKSQIDVAEKKLSVIVRQLVPDVEVSAGYAYQPANYSDSGTYKSGAYLETGLVNLPILYTYKPEIKNAKLELEKVNLNYISTINKAKRNIEMAYETFVTAQLNLNNYNEEILKDSENLFTQFQKLYKIKNVDFASLVSIEESYYDFIEGYANALSDYYIGWINLLREVNTEDFSIEFENL